MDARPGLRYGAAMSAVPVSVVLTTYNHARFVAESLQAAVGQRWPSLEIVVFDDASTDDTWDIICDFVGRYDGPHTLVTHRQPANVGPGLNTLHAVQRARGQFHVRAHGDDISMPNRVAEVMALRQRTGATLITHNAIKASGVGAPATPLRRPTRTEALTLDHISSRGWTDQMLGASFCWDPLVFEVFGAFDRAVLARGGDHVLPLRAAMLSGCWYLESQLMIWRHHKDQMTRKTADYGQHVDVVGETQMAYELTAQLQRMRDVRMMRGRGDRPELVRAENAVLQMILHKVSGWSAFRGKLEAAGQTLRWRPR